MKGLRKDLKGRNGRNEVITGVEAVVLKELDRLTPPETWDEIPPLQRRALHFAAMGRTPRQIRKRMAEDIKAGLIEADWITTQCDHQTREERYDPIMKFYLYGGMLDVSPIVTAAGRLQAYGGLFEDALEVDDLNVAQKILTAVRGEMEAFSKVHRGEQERDSSKEQAKGVNVENLTQHFYGETPPDVVVPDGNTEDSPVDGPEPASKV